MSEKFNWKEYGFQMAGVGLLIASLPLMWLGETGVAWVALGIAGAITASCAIRHKLRMPDDPPTRTVSQWIQDLSANKLIDYAVGSVIIFVMAWSFFARYGFEGGLEKAYEPLVIGLSIHFFADKD